MAKSNPSQGGARLKSTCAEPHHLTAAALWAPAPLPIDSHAFIQAEADPTVHELSTYARPLDAGSARRASVASGPS
jgi:hypothetical protein